MATRSIVLKWIARNQNVDWAHLAWELATLYGARPIRLATLTGEEGSGAWGTWLGNGHIIRTKLTRKNEQRTVLNRTEPNRTDPQRTAPKTNALSDVGSHAFCDRKSSCWGVEKSHVKCCNCCCALATWQKPQTDLGLGSRRRPARSIVTSGVGFSSLYSPSWRCPVYDFISSRQVSSCASLSISLSPSLSLFRVFAISHASLPPNQLVKRRTRLYTPNWHSYSCLIFIFMFIFTQVSLPLSLFRAVSVIH